MRSLVYAAFLAATAALGQTSSTTAKFTTDKGLVVQHDTIFKMTVRFRMQDRFALISEGGDDLDIGSTDIRIRRMRLRFDGYLLSPKLQYKVQLGFSKADMDLVDGTTAQPIRDAVAYYVPNATWSFGLGQTKLPGNRQRVVSSGALQLPDRSLVNALFTLDRDFGVFATWRSHVGHQEVALKGAVSSGEGRNASPGDNGLCYTGRFEWLPLGAFKDEGDYFEGDLAREEHMKLAVGAVYSTNVDTRRVGGQLGEFFPGAEERTLNTWMLDAVLKYRGTSLSTEFCQRDVAGSPIVTELEGSVHAYEGWGWNTQLGRMLGAKNEVVARYTLVRPGERIAALEDQREEAWLGFNRYLNEHRVKVQTAVSYVWQRGILDLNGAGNKWGLWFQLELGI